MRTSLSSVIFLCRTLFSQLDHCVTAFGKRLLKSWLARPLHGTRSIIERQDAIAALKVCSKYLFDEISRRQSSKLLVIKFITLCVPCLLFILLLRYIYPLKLFLTFHLYIFVNISYS